MIAKKLETCDFPFCPKGCCKTPEEVVNPFVKQEVCIVRGDVGLLSPHLNIHNQLSPNLK